jgi:predicted kinase
MKKFKQFSEEMTFKVEVEGLPSLFMSGNSPGQVKNHLRKLIKQPSMIKSVERQTKHDVKKTYLAKAQGKDIDEKTQQSKTHPNLKIAVGKSAQFSKSTLDRVNKRKNARSGGSLAAQHLPEGINDPGIFKAVFLAGGPGSGKSFIVGQTALTSLGLKLINSDNAFEAALAKIGLDPTPENIYSPLGQTSRDKAVALTKKKMELAIQGRLGLVIDGTGKNFEKIKNQADLLKVLGYDTAMIFVNTDLDTALERNRKRQRTLPDSEVEAMWKDVQKNIGKFQSMFRQKMYIVDNSDGSNYKGAVLSTYKKMMAWTNKKPDTKAANAWIKKEKEKRGITETKAGEVDYGSNKSVKMMKKTTPGEMSEISINKIRSKLYKTAKTLGDVQSLTSKRRGSVAKRVVRKAVGRKTASLLGKLFK